jgi:hypothetical protein
MVVGGGGGGYRRHDTGKMLKGGKGLDQFVVRATDVNQVAYYMYSIRGPDSGQNRIGISICTMYLLQASRLPRPPVPLQRARAGEWVQKCRALMSSNCETVQSKCISH